MHYIRKPEDCRECGLCLADCSPLRHGLMVSSTNHANPGSPGCEACGHCYSLCPNAAIDSVGEPGLPEAFQLSDAVPAISPAALFALLSGRRSERRFQNTQVPTDTVTTLLTAAAQTPSGGNARRISCTLLPADGARHDVMLEIRRFYHRLVAIARSPSARFIIGALLGKAAGAFLNDQDYRRRFVALVEGIDAGIDPVFYHAPVVMLFHSQELMPTPEEDAVLSAYNVVLLAQTMGLGTCFVSMAQKAIAASRRVRRVLDLPKKHRVLAVLAVGYPAARRVRPVVREILTATAREVEI